jgi:hypothetical protein
MLLCAARAICLRTRLSSNVDMASFCQVGERIPLPITDVFMNLLPDGERDGANGCHP